MLLIDPCEECVTSEEYNEYVSCWFDKEFQCGDNIKAELRSSYLMIKRILSNGGCDCDCCDDDIKEAIYIQTYYSDNHNFGKDVKTKLMAETYDFLILKGMLYA